MTVLGLNRQEAARRVVRLLLADPLASEQSWERQIDTVGENDGRGLLIRYAQNPCYWGCIYRLTRSSFRYGEGAGTNPQSPLLSHLEIPSSTLRSHNLEILISSIDVTNIPTNSPESVSASKEAFLVPALETTAASASGRYSTVTYPVHKALVFGEGIESAVAYARYTAGHHPADVSHLVKVAIGMDLQPTTAGESEVSTVNLQAAEAAIQAFRQSVDNAITYEHGWLGSGMPTLADFLVQGSQVTDGTVKPAVRALTQSILDDTAENIDKEELRLSQELATAAIPASTRQALNQALTVWAEQAHTELRDQLDRAFSSRRWRRLAWWKLFWRVDDVGMIASEVLERSWLVEAEKEMIWLAGRIQQAGLLVDDASSDHATARAGFALSRKGREQHALGASPPPPTVRDLIPPSVLSSTTTTTDADFDARLPPPRPWPTHVAYSRHILSARTLPDLQALAQRLVLTALSTTTLSSALAALMYVSISTTSVYEAGAIAAAGVVWSMWRLQGRWEAARRGWEGEVREEGRRVLRVVEGEVMGVVREGGKHVEDGDGAEREERRTAREAVVRGREALGRVR